MASRQVTDCTLLVKRGSSADISGVRWEKKGKIPPENSVLFENLISGIR